ncbi:MAG: restriction endonuclease subunit S [Clostridia bacterium]|nr:restriction endonuclease subunit S [Clostridia bacterium]
MREVTLADITLSITDGKHGDCEDQSNSGYYFISCKDVKDGQIIYCQARQITEKDFLDTHKRTKLEPNDILITNSGTIGRMAFIQDKAETSRTTFQKSVAILKPDTSQVLPKYLYYQLQSCVNCFVNQANGSAQKNLLLSTMRAFKLNIQKDFSVQQRVADILSAYDDLIENNQKQIKLLEEAAQRLYKEWFVDLRFPGHETTPIVDGVPEGWKVKSVAECLAFHGNGGWGKETPTGKYTHAGKVMRGTDMPDIRAGQFGDVPLRYHTDVDVQKRVLMRNDLVFELSNGNIDNIGRCLLIDDMILQACGKNMICASFCKLLRPIDQLHAIMLYFEIQDMQSSGRMLPLKKHGSNGINNFDFEGFLSHRFVIPANARYILTLTSILSKISVLRNQLFCLREARDRLLPKLMSGEVEV